LKLLFYFLAVYLQVSEFALEMSQFRDFWPLQSGCVDSALSQNVLRSQVFGGKLVE
jgi:hypothetical protein